VTEPGRLPSACSGRIALALELDEEFFVRLCDDATAQAVFFKYPAGRPELVSPRVAGYMFKGWSI
jgi:hypothetical protein